MHGGTEFVRTLFETFAREGIDGVLRVTPDDVVWAPLAAEGREYVGAEVREFFEARRGTATEQTEHAHAIEEVAPGMVLVTGSVQLRRRGTRVDMQPTWLYEFDDEGLLRRATGFPSRSAARVAIEGCSAS